MSLQKLWALGSTTTNKSNAPDSPQEGGSLISSAGSGGGRRRNGGQFLVLSRVYDSMSQVLGLRELQDYLQGNTSSLPLSCNPLWLLGTPYIVAERVEATEGAPDKLQPICEAWEEFLADFRARLWVTYRKDFPPIGDSGLTSDVGWGCTLRSGQMLLAEALRRAALHRQGGGGSNLSAVNPGPDPELPGSAWEAELRSVLRQFWDLPEAGAPYSIHNICAIGSRHGVVPGEWLGPYVICKTLAAAVNGREAAGLRVDVAAEPSGGAPMICSRPPEPDDSSSETGAFPRLLLVPLTLGIDKMNPVYHSQLKAVLRLSQSVGIIGGRPSSSLYFIGTQDDHLLYLDPHFTRPAPCSDEDYASFHCSTVRHLHISMMDPSLAIGFFCATPQDFANLCSGLADLEASSSSAPLMTIRDEVPALPSRQVHGFDWDDDTCSSPLSTSAAAEGNIMRPDRMNQDGDDEDEWELM